MASFIGRSGHQALFKSNENAVVVDTRSSLVTASGPFLELNSQFQWESGEFSANDQAIAETALEALSTAAPGDTGRLYTVPRGVKVAAQRAQEVQDEYTLAPGAKAIGAILASGGQIGFNQLVYISNYFSRHEDDNLAATKNGPSESRVQWDLFGGDAGKKWASNIVSREVVTASAGDVKDIYEMLQDSDGPEFVARISTEGDGIDRLYRIDIDGRTYAWDDNAWTDFGHADWNIWKYDSYLDDDFPVDGENSIHTLIDPESALYVASNLRYGSVFVEDINPAETRLALASIDSEDWELIDSTLTAAGAVGDGIYTEEERSQNAGKQVRDKNGKFAKQGGRVMVNGVPGNVGTITRVNQNNGTVEVAMANGGSQVVNAKQVESVGDYTTTIPGKPVEVPRVDFSGILAEPRTPSNRVQGQLPGTLPAMTSSDLHAIINNFPAWVKSQRESFKDVRTPGNVSVQAKDSKNLGADGEAYSKKIGKTLQTDAYDHPLLNQWLNKKNNSGNFPNQLWYKPIIAAGEAEADAEAAPQEVTPEASDVQPVYMAIVSPDDPRAVFQLISLVPASSTSTAPMVYSRKDGQWVRDDQALNDLRSATPPPVVPLDSDALNDTLQQVDGAQAENSEEDKAEAAKIAAQPLPDESALPPGAPPVTDVVVASADEAFDLMVLWGPREDMMKAALVAAGGADRNRGNAEELRHYWTRGAGAAKIRWGTEGDWTRCVRNLRKHMGARAEGYCQLRHKEMNGHYTGDQKNEAAIEAAEEFTVDPRIVQIISELGLDESGTNTVEASETLLAAGGADRNRGGAEKLRNYWTKGPGAAKIGWGTPGDWTRCVKNLGKYLGPRAKGYCALRHREMTGKWAGDRDNRQTFSLVAASNAFSTSYLESTDRVLQGAVLRARREIAINRVNGLVASGVPQLPVDIFDGAESALEAITAGAMDNMAVGGAFWIPIALPEGIESGDGRFVEEGIAEIRNLPISLLWQFKTASGHDGSVVVGRIEKLHRIPGGIGAGYGHFDIGPWGREAERMVRNGMLRFVSADMDKFGATKESGDPEAAADPNVIESQKVTVTKARVMAVTIVAKPAFQEATIEIVPDPLPEEEDVFLDGLFMDDPDPVDAPALVAAGYIAEAIPVVPPRNWFKDPELTGPTPLTVTDDGRVYGHVAAWSSGHINPRLNGINPPRSASRYAYFNTGVVRTDDGTDVNVGQITLAGGHAGLEFSAKEAVKHYDDTGSAMADVHAGEDNFGIWVAGSLRPGVTPEQVRAFRASVPSGDWRPIRGNLELVAVCQVNVPGFPQARAFVASGQMTALVAAGAMPLAKMKSDPLGELSARIEALEDDRINELNMRAEALSARMAPAIDEVQARLDARAEAVFSTMENFGYVFNKATPKKKSTSEALTASVEDMRSQVLEFAYQLDEDEKNKKVLDGGRIVTTEDEEGRPKYKPGYQPRDYEGQFRDVLARLKEDLGTSGNQGVVEDFKKVNAKIQAGDYVSSARGALHLQDVLDRLDSGALDATSISNVREASKQLGTVISNLPLPFDNQTEKVRFSDVPPALRELMKEFVERVEEKIGKKDAASAVAPLKAFMTGSDLFSQSDISKQMSTLLRLLT